MNALEISHISKVFSIERQKVHALTDVSLEIEEGEIFGVLGPNGAGKTTMLNCVVGLLEEDSGTIKALGKDPVKEGSVLEEMNYISGESEFHWSLNAYQILDFFGRLYHVPAHERKKRIDELIAMFEIKEFAGQRFDSLSTGQRMRLVLAKALINNPRLLLLDEPTLGLDPHIAARVRELIIRINQDRKTTIILTSHYMSEVEQLCGRIAFIDKGRIVDIGRVREVKQSRFAGYEVAIELKRVFGKKYLEGLGFKIEGKRITANLSNDENISGLLSRLSARKYSIVDIDVKRPSLEDYFMRMMRHD